MKQVLLESHKLMYHPERVAQWLKKGDTYPIYVEISPSGLCNSRCIFCAFDYLNYQPTFVETPLLIKRLKEMARLGIKSINYSGEGEPLLHKDMTKIIERTKQIGLDVSLTTNGTLFSKDLAERMLQALSWVRFSVNAGDASTYSKVHNVKGEYFNQVIDNLTRAVRLKKRKQYPVTIGVQIVLLKENFQSILKLAQTCKQIGVDYFVVKPFIEHPESKSQLNSHLSPKKLTGLKNRLDSLSGGGFKAVLRADTFSKLTAKRPYQRCLALSFFAQITSCGDVYTCIPYVGNTRFKYGNIYKQGFKEIWQGQARRDILRRIRKLDVNRCMSCCRPDEVNRYLWGLVHPPLHKNFI